MLVNRSLRLLKKVQVQGGTRGAEWGVRPYAAASA
jgi:hypothetical protein